MGSNESSKGKVKKVAPYPFAAVLELNALKKSMQVVFVSPKGMIAQLAAGQMVVVGEHYQLTMELPTHRLIQAQVRVIKTYDRSVDPKQHRVERMAEFHFESLNPEQHRSISSFNVAIGQK